MELKPRTTKSAKAEQTPAGWRLSIPAGEAGQYRLAQLDNCTHLSRQGFPYHSLDMRLRARISSTSVPGTWGFGAWNDPYRMGFSRGENLFNMFTLPNAAWFFHSSEESYLSFRDDKPGNGFVAQTFRAQRKAFLPLLGTAGLILFSRVAARRKLSSLIGEDSVLLDHDTTQWHTYKMNWALDRVVFEVDGVKVLVTETSPYPRLGAVIWIDNQFAAFTPQGRIASGTLANHETWLELEELELKA